MKGIMIAGLALILIIAVPFTVLGESQGRGGHWSGHWSGHWAGQASGTWNGFAVSNPNHTQALGGTSTHACNGLSRAADHAPVVTPVTPPPSSSGSGSGISGGDFGTVTPSGPGTL